MPRGVSISPQKGKTVLPEHLKNSLFEIPDDMGGGNRAYGTFGPQSAGSPTGSNGLSNTSFAYYNVKEHERNVSSSGNNKNRPQKRVQIFDEEGNLNYNQTGVHSFRFKRLNMFYLLRSQSWLTLLSVSITLYLMILLSVTVMYYLWGQYCGAGGATSFLTSLYFSVVSLAANGGYMGEDPERMTDPDDACYRGRTLIVMICSYGNIIFVGLVAALVVGKAEYTGKLANRIVFSDFCTLVPVPGRLDRWKLAFRMANVENTKPLAHGCLRLFLVAAEPLDEYRQIQREKKLWQASRKQLLPQIASAENLSAMASLPLTSETLKKKKSKEHANLSESNDPIVQALLKFKREEMEKKSSSKKEGTKEGKPQRRGRSRRRRGKPNREGRSSSAHKGKDKTKSHSGHSGRNQSGSPLDQNREPDTVAVAVRDTPPPPRRHRSSGSHDDGDSSISGTSSRTCTPDSSDSGNARRQATGDMADNKYASEIHSDKTNSSFEISDEDEHRQMLASPVGPSPNRKFPQGASGNNSRSNTSAQIKDADEYERVRLRVSELRWECPEESYIDKDANQLSLWYPSTITHMIDERSPLYHFLDLPRLSAMALGDVLHNTVVENNSFHEIHRDDYSNPVGGDYGGMGNNISGSRANSGNNDNMKQLNSNRFQIVAVFDATEMETGAAIVSRKTYTTTDIVTHYRFSTKLVHIKPISNEVYLDYHYFNALVPQMMVEDSSDSDV